MNTTPQKYIFLLYTENQFFPPVFKIDTCRSTSSTNFVPVDLDLLPVVDLDIIIIYGFKDHMNFQKRQHTDATRQSQGLCKDTVTIARDPIPCGTTNVSHHGGNSFNINFRLSVSGVHK